MNLGIAGKVALVTASSQGLGKAVAHALAAEGVKLAMFSRSDELLTTAAKIEKDYHVPVLPIQGDMRSDADVERLVAAVLHAYGGIDILVLNTGSAPHPARPALEETDDARWEAAYRTQLWATVLVTRKVVPLLVDRGWGRVIAITAATVKQPKPRHPLSTIFRAGVTGYMKHLANETAAQGVTVNTVCPGSIDTRSGARTSAETAERIKRVPVGRLGRPEELGATVAFLASDYAGFITGASLQVDGGTVSSLI